MTYVGLTTSSCLLQLTTATVRSGIGICADRLAAAFLSYRSRLNRSWGTVADLDPRMF